MWGMHKQTNKQTNKPTNEKRRKRTEHANARHPSQENTQNGTMSRIIPKPWVHKCESSLSPWRCYVRRLSRWRRRTASPQEGLRHGRGIFLGSKRVPGRANAGASRAQRVCTRLPNSRLRLGLGRLCADWSAEYGMRTVGKSETPWCYRMPHPHRSERACTHTQTYTHTHTHAPQIPCCTFKD